MRIIRNEFSQYDNMVPPYLLCCLILFPFFEDQGGQGNRKLGVPLLEYWGKNGGLGGPTRVKRTIYYNNLT